MSAPLFTPEIADQILSLLREGHTIRIAAESCGVSERTVYNWRQRGRSDAPEDEPYRVFRGCFVKASAEGIREIERSVIAAAKEEGSLGLKVLGVRDWRRWGSQQWRIRSLEKRVEALEAKAGIERAGIPDEEIETP